MKLQGRELKPGLTGADVRLLQFELSLLDLQVGEDEEIANLYGDKTESAVVAIQDRSGLQPSGTVDPDTARVINVSVAERVPPEDAGDKLGTAIKELTERIGDTDPGASGAMAQAETMGDTLEGFALAFDTLVELDLPDPNQAELKERLSEAAEKLRALAEAIGGQGGDPTPPDDTSRRVRGTVSQADGEPIPGASLRLVARGLTAATSHTLATTRSDDAGRYALTYRQTSADAPHLIVEVLGTDQQRGPIERSPLIVDPAPDQQVDLVVASEALPRSPEFDQIAARLAPELGDVAPAALDTDAVSVLAAKTSISPIRIAQYAQAHRDGDETGVPADIFYGLYRANMPLSRAALVAQDADTLCRAVQSAAKGSVIRPDLAEDRDSVDALVERIASSAVDSLLDTDLGASGSAIAPVLDAAGLSDADKRAVVRQLQASSARGETFYEGLSARGVAQPAIDALQTTAQLGALTLGNRPLMAALQAKLNGASGETALRDLVSLSEGEWLEAVRDQRDATGRANVPAAFLGGDGTAAGDDAEARYATTMFRMIETAFPTPSLVARTSTDSFEGRADLESFLADQPDFEFRRQSLPAYLRANEINLDTPVRARLETVGRLMALAPDTGSSEVVRHLSDAGITTALQIRTLGRRRFMERMEGRITPTIAKRVMAKAAKRTATASALMLRYGTAFTKANFGLLPGLQPEVAFENITARPGQIDFPTWESLFGTLDSCACEHCASIYSPSAYLVALLKFLHDRGALDVLEARRPDIGHIELNCRNTNTEVPYIDLVLEVLEALLVEGGTIPASQVRQTEREAAELRVHPQAINAEAYRLLEEEQEYPWTAPFSLWTEEMRAYLGPLGASRAEVLDTLQTAPQAARTDSEWRAFATERCGLTDRALDIVLDTNFANARWGGSGPGGLDHVAPLLRAAGIEYPELLQLLATRFVNFDNALSIDFATGTGEDAQLLCDLEEAEIAGITAEHLTRLQRFVRLRRGLGWSTHDLDIAIAALGGVLTEATVVRIAHMSEIMARLDVSVSVAASWVAPIDTHAPVDEAGDPVPSVYARLFLDRSTGGEEEIAPFQLTALVGSGPQIADNSAAVLAALQIVTAEELADMLDRRLPNGDLTLDNLSHLHRLATLARALGLRVGALIDLLELSGLDPFAQASMRDALTLADHVDLIETLDTTPAELAFLLRGDPDPAISPTAEDLGRFLSALSADLATLRAELTAVPDPEGELTAELLGRVLSPAILAQVIAIAGGRAQADELPADPVAFLQAELAAAIPDAATRAALAPRLADSAAAGYLDPEREAAERFALILEPLTENLRRVQSTAAVRQAMSDLLGWDIEAGRLLLETLIHDPDDATRPVGTLFTDPAFIDANGAVDAAAFPAQFGAMGRLVRISVLVTQLRLPTEELEPWVTDFGVLGELDPNALPTGPGAAPGNRLAEWRRMADAARLERQWPRGGPSVRAMLRQGQNTAAGLPALLNMLAERTGWARADLDALTASTRFGIDDLAANWSGPRTLANLLRLDQAMDLLSQLGVPADLAWQWADASTTTRVIAAGVKQAARAKYTESQWLAQAEPIRDGLRQKQRDALAAAVIEELNEPAVRTIDDLYARCLMDAKMEPCMPTSRIVFATSAVQLLIQRAFLNLEPQIDFDNEDARIWEWLKYYRVFEANVRVLVEPENYLEPSLKIEKTPGFRTLEQELLQTDVTRETLELAYEGYFDRLDEVARLSIVGAWRENDTKTLHVVGRTRGTPRKYFYRRWVEERRWEPWAEVPLDIEGETVTPVIYNRRPYLFWLTTIEKAEEEVVNEKAPERYLEIRLAWSQYRQRKWLPKRLSDVVITTERSRLQIPKYLSPSTVRPRPIIRRDGTLFVAVERSSLDSGTSFLDSSKLVEATGFRFVNDGEIELGTYNSPRRERAIAAPVQNSDSWAYYFERSRNQSYRLRGQDASWQTVFTRLPAQTRTTVPLQYTDFRSGAPFFCDTGDRIYVVSPRHRWGPRPSWQGDLTLEFPQVDLFVDLEDEVRWDDLTGPLTPGGPLGPPSPDDGPVRGLGPLINPVGPRMEAASGVLGARAGSDSLGSLMPGLAGPGLAVVRGGGRVTGGAVSVPLIDRAAPVTGFAARALATGSETRPLALLSNLGAAPVTGLAVEEVGLSTRALTGDPSAIYNEYQVASAAITAANLGVYWGLHLSVYRGTTYTFHTLYHPFADILIRELNRYGIDGVLDPREGGPADDLRRQLLADPNGRFSEVFELGPAINDSAGALPKEDFDFDVASAQAVYNREVFIDIPFLCAKHLSANGRHEEAQAMYHYLFNPLDKSDLPAETARYRFWKVKPFFQNTDIRTTEELLRLLSSDRPEDLEARRDFEAQIRDWRLNPFQPHRIAEHRPEAYQKAIVMGYLDNLIAWGDMLFRRDTRESVFEAIQIYLLAQQILGERPVQVEPPEGTRTIDGAPVATFNDLRPHLDVLGNALVRIETELAGADTPDEVDVEGLSGLVGPADFTTPGEIDIADPDLDLTAEPPIHDIVGSALFFCVPANRKLLSYWDTVEDRLFKIRNCLNIAGVERSLALFAPPIDPALLVRATAAGLDLGAVLGDLNAPRPRQKFPVVISQARRVTGETIALGQALLSALEKQDAEDLALLRQRHERQALDAMRLVREQNVDEAKEALQGLRVNRDAATDRQTFFEKRQPLIPTETEQLTRMEVANLFDNLAQGFSLVGSALALIPEFDVGAEGGFSSPTVKAQFGGTNLSRMLGFYSQLYGFFGSVERRGAERAGLLAGQARRLEDWVHSAGQAELEGEALDNQILAAEIRLAVREHELTEHDKEVERLSELSDFMRDKFTNRELYSWMISSISGLYFQSYQLAHDLAKRAEQALRAEVADPALSFIQFGHWDGLRKGLLAGERLQLDLSRMEAARMERSRRERQLEKTVSLREIDPAALLQLRETGRCEFEVPEALYRFDFPSHYLLRIKSVGLTIPTVSGPYSGAKATLTLLSDRIRTSTTDPQTPYAGVDDPRFTTNTGGIEAVSTSGRREDTGLFETPMEGETLLPFEQRGAISRWRVELGAQNDDGSIRFRSFDYDTISDVLLHIRYTARDGGRAVANAVVPALAGRVNAIANATAEAGLIKYVGFRHEQTAALHRFLNPEGTGDHTAEFTLSRSDFPYLFQDRLISLAGASVLVSFSDPGDFAAAATLQFELTRGTSAPETAAIVQVGALFGGIPHAAFTFAAPVAEVETWTLRLPAAAVAALDQGYRESVTIGGTTVERLARGAVKDIALLLRYNVG